MTIDYDGPVGEHPDFDTQVAQAVDRASVVLMRKLSDTRAQLDNLYPALIAAHDANAAMARELKAHRDELAEAEREIDQRRETDCRVQELEAEVQELRETVAGLRATR